MNECIEEWRRMTVLSCLVCLLACLGLYAHLLGEASGASKGFKNAVNVQCWPSSTRTCLTFELLTVAIA